RFEEVTIRAIAQEAGVSLSTLYAHFSSRGHILAGFTKDIDRAVLAGNFADMADEHPRDRLFDVLMARLDALVPYRLGIGELLRAARRDGALALGLNALSMQSLAWMMAAADLSVSGWKGRVAVQSLSIAFANVLRVFADEDDPGMPRTMAKLDSELRGLEARHKRFAKMFGSAVGRGVPPRRRASQGDGSGNAGGPAGADTGAAADTEPKAPSATNETATGAASPDMPPAPTMPGDGGSFASGGDENAGEGATDDATQPPSEKDKPNETP
ncbi:MAG: TetR family transcriptional regulator, partial [Pseudomonadota bacterium]